MKVAALQTARDGSKSIPKKNELPFNGKPLYQYNIDAALKAKSIEGVYCSTDIESICKSAPEIGFDIIARPENMRDDDASHYDVILHGLSEIEKKQGQIDALFILLGNSAGCNSQDLDAAVSMLEETGSDSVISVSEFNMFNPFRAYYSKNNRLQTFIDQKEIESRLLLSNPNDKKAAGDILFFNGSFWLATRESIVNNDGLLPFPWLGKDISYIVQNHQIELDAAWQISVVKENINEGRHGY